MSRGELKLFACRSGEEFAKRILSELRKKEECRDLKLGDLKTIDFSNEEMLSTINETVRGCDIYLVQCCQDPLSGRSVQDNFLELCQCARGMIQSGANKVTAIIPLLPYSRQDRREGRQSITARWAADVLKISGVDNVITADLHADQIEGFYDGRIQMDNLRASAIFLNYIKENIFEEGKTVLLAPDVGASKKTEFYAKKLETRGVAQAFKTRPRPNEVEGIKVVGRIDERDVIIIEDMIDTGGTLKKVIHDIKRIGAQKVYAFCTHPIFSGPAIERLSESDVKVFSTDTIIRDWKFFEENPWFTEISIAPLFSEAIYNLNHGISVSELFNGAKDL